jgi:membrane protein DedA with SNARE-associated domain
MSFFTNLIYKYGVIAMFFIILIEYACFPISSEIVLPFSGAVASIQGIHFFTIVPASVVAGIIGTSFCYFVGRMGGKKLLDKIMKKFPKSQNGIKSSMEKFQRYGSFALFFGRLIPLVRTYIAFVAGAANLNYPSFLFSSLIGITIWNTLLIGLGYSLREKWDVVGVHYGKYKEIVLPLLLLTALYIIVKARRRK